jgi:hypothetical protein
MIPGLLLEASQTIAYPHPMQLAAEGTLEQPLALTAELGR